MRIAPAGERAGFTAWQSTTTTYSGGRVLNINSRMVYHASQLRVPAPNRLTARFRVLRYNGEGGNKTPAKVLYNGRPPSTRGTLTMRSRLQPKNATCHP